MIRICKMAHLDRDPLQGAGLSQAALQPSTPGAPISFKATSDCHLQRANGSGRIVLGSSERGTRIIDLFQKSPVRIMFPRVTGGAMEEAVLINTGGGIAGGDRLEYEVTACETASISVTTQAAEKIYGALDEPARINTKLKVAEPAQLAWLPQETIVFNGARISRSTEIDVSSGAEMLALEWLVLGRSAYGEQMLRGQIMERWRVKKDGRLIWADAFRSVDEIFPQLHKKALLAHFKSIGTLVYFGRELDHRLESIRDIVPHLDCCGGATLVGGVMIVRFAAQGAFELRLALDRVLQQFRLELGAGPFGVPKMWSC